MSTQNRGKGQYQARLENQKAQLERHGNFAEVVIRTTPEGTDVINFARLWEHILVMGDRSTRGYMAKQSREDFDKTRDDFDACIEFMVKKMKECIKRHDIDLTGNNFISRVAQRYHISEKKAPKQPEKQAKSNGAEVKESKEEAAAPETKAPKKAKAGESASKPAESKSKPTKKEEAAPAAKAENSSGVLNENVEGF